MSKKLKSWLLTWCQKLYGKLQLFIDSEVKYYSELVILWRTHWTQNSNSRTSIWKNVIEFKIYSWTSIKLQQWRRCPESVFKMLKWRRCPKSVLKIWKWRGCPESVSKPKPAFSKIYVFPSRICRGVDVLWAFFINMFIIKFCPFFITEKLQIRKMANIAFYA